MTPDTIDESQHKAARVAGFALLLAMVIVVIANYAISFRLIVSGDAAETARNIMENELLFRINIACDLIYLLTLVILLSALHVIFLPVSRTLALVAALCRLLFASMWIVAALHMLSALRLLGDTAYQAVFDADQLQNLARLHLAGSYDAYYIGLPFWGLASTLCAYLWFKSRYIPRSLAAYGLISSAWCVFCAFAFLVYPAFANTVGASWFDVPMVMFELALGVWLLSKGISRSVATGLVQRSDLAQVTAA